MSLVIADIYRYDPTIDARPRMQRYEIPYRGRMNVLSLLRYIFNNIDPSLAFRNYECSRGICNTCRIQLNGHLAKACSVSVQPGDHLVIRPYQERRVIRDLVCYEE